MYIYQVIEPDQLQFVFADPRRMTGEFKLVMEEFGKVPLIRLGDGLGLLAVNCDDVNDQRKFVKKNFIGNNFKLLSDPTKRVTYIYMYKIIYDT